MLVTVLITFFSTCYAEATQSAPNIVLIVVDDQRWDEFGAGGHPYLETPNIDQLAKEGTQFTQSYVVSPLCSPNRASILTGQYPSRHGILDNIARDAESHRLDVFARDLQRAGYRTAHVGKWHMGNDASARPGYDYWVSFPGQGRSVDPELFENGKLQIVSGYMTDILTDRAIEFIRSGDERPFFLYIGHKAIHPDVEQRDDSSIDIAKGSRFIAADRHVNRYHDKVYPRRKNAIDSVDSIAGKPVIAEILASKTSAEIRQTWEAVLDHGTAEATIRDRTEMLLAVDEGLGRILGELENRSILDNTVVILTSDNGYFYGEHGLSIERRLPYEEAVRVPLIVRYPAVFPQGRNIDQFVLSIDIAPTILDLAHVDKGDHIQGKSLLELLLRPSKHWRDSFLIENFSYEKPMPWLVATSYKVIRKGNYKYIHWLQHPDKNELYDLQNDPYELVNLINEPRYRQLREQLKRELAVLASGAMGL